MKLNYNYLSISFIVSFYFSFTVNNSHFLVYLFIFNVGRKIKVHGYFIFFFNITVCFVSAPGVRQLISYKIYFNESEIKMNEHILKLFQSVLLLLIVK